MDMRLQKHFLQLWDRYFGGAEIPITYFYSETPGDVEVLEAPEPGRCLLADLIRVRAGRSLAFQASSFACGEGRAAFGFPTQRRPHFDYFFSCGIPGDLEGLRFKQSPALVQAMLSESHPPRAPQPFLVFKRWDALVELDLPEIVVFFVGPDELAGLFMLAHFDESISDAVLAPFASGCAAIGARALAERPRDPQRAVLGLFDPAARACLPETALSFAVPIEKFQRMVTNMEESFLTTPAWERVRARICAQGQDEAA